MRTYSFEGYALGAVAGWASYFALILGVYSTFFIPVLSKGGLMTLLAFLLMLVCLKLLLFVVPWTVLLLLLFFLLK